MSDFQRVVDYICIFFLAVLVWMETGFATAASMFLLGVAFHSHINNEDGHN